MAHSISRRSFASLAVGAVAVAFVTAAPREASAEGGLKFELYADGASEFRWRLKAGNGEILATAGQGYRAKAEARTSIDRIRNELDRLTFETYEDARQEFRWRLMSRNGQVVAASSDGYKAHADVDKAVERIRAGAKDATLVDETHP